MFCRLNQAKNATSLDLSDFETCEDTCKYFKDDSCSVSEGVSIFLSKERFGWRIDSKIAFSEPIPSKSENTHYCGLVQLIHPTYSDVWIVNALKKDKETQIVLVYQEGKHLDSLSDFESLNEILRSKYHYKGRDIGYDDFKVGETDV